MTLWPNRREPSPYSLIDDRFEKPNGLVLSAYATPRSRLIDSSLRAIFKSQPVGFEGVQTAPPSGAALLEFDALNRLTFATREAQALLRFAPLWGQTFHDVLQRVPQPLRRIEWLIAAAQPPSPTTKTLGSAFAWLHLVMSEERVLTICLRDQPRSR